MYDVCIIGSGAGAGPVAYELAHNGQKVVVLEKGHYYTREDFFKDELAIRRDVYTPPLTQQQHVIQTQNEKGQWISVQAKNSNWNFWNGSMVGGSSNLMSGYFLRLKPNDFKLKTVYGAIKGANIVDWPISYSDLEPFYDKAEKIVGVSGKVVQHPYMEPRSSKDFPFPPLWEQPISSWIDNACKKLDYHVFPTPRAILPYPALGRLGCSYSNFCGSYGCATGAKGNARSALLDSAVKTGNCTIISDAFAFKIDSDSKRATKVSYFDKNNNIQNIKAKVFVVACQAIETSRLLLNSKNVHFPNGLLNNYNQVGKNLIFSAGGTGHGTFEFKNLPKSKHKDLMVRGAFVNRTIQDWYEFENNGKKIKGGGIDFLYEGANPTYRAMTQIYDKDSKLIWGIKLQQKLKHAFLSSRVLNFEVFNDWSPTDNCYVGVDEGVRDKWGIPVGLIRLNSNPHDEMVGSFLAQKAVNVLKQMGATNIKTNISPSPPTNLQAGGCRFGDDERSSVLDKNCRAHALDNLYITDGSFMPTGGSVPYTFTIYANSFRVADVIKRRFG